MKIFFLNKSFGPRDWIDNLIDDLINEAYNEFPKEDLQKVGTKLEEKEKHVLDSPEETQIKLEAKFQFKESIESAET